MELQTLPESSKSLFRWAHAALWLFLLTFCSAVASLADAGNLTITIPFTNQQAVASLAPVTLPFTVSDGTVNPASLTVAATSTNTAVISQANVAVGGSGANRTVILTPTGYGAAGITLSVNDGAGHSTSAGFAFQVDSVPVVTAIPNQTVTAPAQLGPLNFTVTNAALPDSKLQVIASSSDATVVSGLKISGPTGDQYALTGNVLKSGPCIVTVTVLDGFGAYTSTAFGVGSALPQPAVSINSATGALDVRTGINYAQATFNVTLSSAQTVPVSVNYVTVNGTAIGGTDYVAESGALTFEPGASTVQLINVPLLDSGHPSTTATFTVVLSNPNPGNVVLGNATGTGTILGYDPALLSLSPSALSSHAGVATNVTATYVDAGGNGLLNHTQIAIGAVDATGVPHDSVQFDYAPGVNKLYAVDTFIGGTSGGFAPGSAEVITTEYGSLDCSKTTVTKSGYEVTVSWNINFNPQFIGNHTIYLQDSDQISGTPWQTFGTWTVGPSVPYSVSLSPASLNSPAGTPETLQATYGDSAGYTALSQLQICVGTNGSPSTSLYAEYLPATNLLYLFDASNEPVGGFAPGSSNVITTQLGSLDCSKCSVASSSDNTTVVWNISPSIQFLGSQNVYLETTDTGAASNWAKYGTWIVTPSLPSAVSLAPATLQSSAGVARVLTATYADGGGYGLLAKVQICIGTNGYPSTSLYAEYLPISNLLYLFNASNDPVGGLVPGSSNVITTPLGALDCSRTTVSGSGNNLTVNWSLAPSPAMMGTQSLYLQAVDPNSASPWSKFGTWTITAPVPAAVGLSPSTLSTLAGTKTAVTATYTDGAGFGALTQVQVCVGSNGYPSSSLYAECLPATNLLYLFNANNAPVGGFAPGSSNIITTPLGSLDCSQTTVSGSGNNLTVVWSISPSAPLLGNQKTYLQASGANSAAPWTQFGTWTVFGPEPSVVSLSPTSVVSNAGTPAVIIATYSDTAGFGALTQVQFCLGQNGYPSTSLYAEYLPATNLLYLFNANNVAIGGFAPGSDNVISAPLGSLDCSETRVSGTGNNLTVLWDLTPSAALAGTQLTYLQASDASAGTSWTLTGNWTISAVTAAQAGKSAETSAAATSSHKL